MDTLRSRGARHTHRAGAYLSVQRLWVSVQDRFPSTVHVANVLLKGSVLNGEGVGTLIRFQSS